MPDEVRTYRVGSIGHARTLVWVFLAAICFSLSLFIRARPVILFCLLLLLFGLFSLVRQFYEKVQITDTTIIVTRYFRTKQIRWDDVSSLEAKRAGFLLINSGGDRRIFVTKEAVYLWEFIGLVDRRRRDLLQPTKTVFHEHPVIAALMAIAGSLMVFISVAQIFSNSVDRGRDFFLLIMGLAAILFAIFVAKRFSFSEDRLVVWAFGRQSTICLEDIESGFVSNQSVLLISRQRASALVTSLIEGFPAFLLTLHSWLSSHPRPKQGIPGNLYEPV